MVVVYVHNEHGGGGEHDDDDGEGPDVGGFVCVKQCPAGRVIYLCKGPESKGLSGQGLQLIMHSCSWCPAALLRYSCNSGQQCVPQKIHASSCSCDTFQIQSCKILLGS